MSDKEKLEKENEQFSSAILYVATAVYVGVCAMVFGALYAKLPSFGEAFLGMMKDYGTVLAGIPVLVAVVVAKQQLDANRHQHNINVRLTFKDILTALGKIRRYCGTYTRFDLDDFIQIGDSEDHHGPLFTIVSEVDLDYIRLKLDSTFYGMLKQIKDELDAISFSFDHDEDIDTLRKRYGAVSKKAVYLVRLVNEEEKNISRYWS